MKNLKLFASLLLCVLFTSCLGSNESTMTMNRQLLPINNFSYITDLENQSSAINAAGSTTTISIDFNAQTCGVDVAGLQLKPGGANYSFSIEPTKFTFDRIGALQLSIPSYVDPITGTTIDNFKLRMLERTMNNMGFPIWNISFRVDNKYDVVVVQNNMILFGESVFTDPDGKEFTTNTPYYGLIFDNKSLEDGNKLKGKFYFYNVQFTSSAQMLNLFTDTMTFTFNESGYRASAENVKVYQEGIAAEQSKYAITDFKLNARYNQETVLDTSVPNVLTRFNIGDFAADLSLGYDVVRNNTQQ